MTTPVNAPGSHDTYVRRDALGSYLSVAGVYALVMKLESDAVFYIVASYLGDDTARFVAEVESVEL